MLRMFRSYMPLSGEEHTMPDKSTIGRLIDRTPLAVIVIGVILFVIGAAGGWPSPSLQVNEMGWRVALGAMGVVVAGIGGLLLRRETRAIPRGSSEVYLASDYGIKIEMPRNGAELGGRPEVSGSYTKKPPDGALRLFVVVSDGSYFWPQEVVKQFDTKNKKWYARIYLGGSPSYGAVIIAAIVGQSSQILWDYYYKVGPQTGWSPIDGWPADVIECDKVGVTRV